MIHNPCHARRAMASKARPWLGKGTHSATEQFLWRIGSLSLAMLSFASHCEAGNDAVVLYQPTMIPGTRPLRSAEFRNGYILSRAKGGCIPEEFRGSAAAQ